MPRISLAVAEKLHKVYGEFSHLMYSEAFGILSNRDDAEDSVQEACMNIMRSPQTLMRIEDAETLQPYLRIVARNAAKQVWVKRRYHFREISLESNLDWIDNVPDTDCLPIDKACEKVDAEAFASRLTFWCFAITTKPKRVRLLLFLACRNPTFAHGFPVPSNM